MYVSSNFNLIIVICYALLNYDTGHLKSMHVLSVASYLYTYTNTFTVTIIIGMVKVNTSGIRRQKAREWPFTGIYTCMYIYVCVLVAIL